MAKPTLVVVTDDPGTLTAATQALERRFGADYQVVAADAPAAALTALRQAGEQVALLLAGQWLEGMTGIEFLCCAHELHPAAKRVLLIPFGDVAAGVAGLQWRLASSTTGSTPPGGARAAALPGGLRAPWMRSRGAQWPPSTNPGLQDTLTGTGGGVALTP